MVTVHSRNSQKGPRLEDIDTTKIEGSCKERAIKAREELEDKLHSGSQICVRIEETGHYGRYIAEVYVDGENVNDWLMKNDLAVEYGKKTC
jgi:endonuclease YncB( thermonuclease family)